MEDTENKNGFQMKLRYLFSQRLWALDTSRLTASWRYIVRFFKLAIITVDSFAENRMGFQCVALSYFVTLSIVPFAALIFAVTGGLGLDDQITPFLTEIMPNNPDMITRLTDKAYNILNSARSGLVGFIGALSFFWTIVWLMFQVERVFNNVWGIRKIPRKMYKRFSFYIFAVLISPFLVILFFTGIAAYSNVTKLIGLDLVQMRFLGKFLSLLVFYIITAGTMAVMYKYIPATKVLTRNAIEAALVSAVFFIGFQYLYLQTQLFVSRLNGVYGAIAAVPLFLIWMNFSWQIIMYGAQLSYGLQNIDSYKI